MIWLTWRQLRPGALMMAALLASLAAVLAVTGHEAGSDYSSGLAACSKQGDCSGFLQGFFEDYRTPFLLLSLLVILLPALIGLFWGAPLLARELEAGTHRLVWNQGVTRSRWLTVKLALVGAAAAAAAGIGTLAVTWWASPVDKAAAGDYPKMAPLLFGARGIVPIGYAVFAFALGLTVGMLLRRTLPAMAVMLAAFVVVQVAMPMLVRPHLMTPVETTRAVQRADIESFMSQAEGSTRMRLNPKTAAPGGWMLSSATLDPAGSSTEWIDLPLSLRSCPGTERPEQAADCAVAKANELGYRVHATYQPASRFWAFQWIETGIYLVLSAGLGGFCFWWVRRRLT